MKTNLFVYGTLQDAEILELVLGTESSWELASPAILHGHQIVRAQGEDFPVLLPSRHGKAQGALLLNLTSEDWLRLNYYEDEEYRRKLVQVEYKGELVGAVAFFPASNDLASEEYWDFSLWQKEKKKSFLEKVQVYMKSFGTGGKGEW